VSYQVLARKWRPQTFSDVVGQTSITQTLVNAIKLDRIGHAFLFSGSRGIGKTTTARILAKALNCENGPTPEPCNKCRHCREITSGIAMDVIEIDGASNRGIDEIRELRDNVKYSPATARFKIIIIDEVHMLTREAFNALLKTLEEPPEHAKFIIATTEAHKIPVTIVSRCQRYDFRRIDTATLTTFLAEICRKENIKVQDGTLEVLARMADGGLRDSLSLLDQVISYSGQEIDHDQTMDLLGRIDPELLFDVFRNIAEGTGSGALERFNSYIDNGGDETIFNREMMEITRDIMAVKMGATSHNNIPGNIPDLFTFDQLERIFKVLLNQEQAFRYTEHPRLLMDVSLIKMSRIQKLTPLGDILDRLKKINGSRNIDSRIPQRPGQNRQPANIPRPVPRPVKPPQQKAALPSPPRPKPRIQPAKPPLKDPTEDGESQPGNRSPVQIEDKPETDNTPLRSLIAQISNSHAPLKGMLSYASVTDFTKTNLSLVFHPDYRIHLDLLQQYDDIDALLTSAAREIFDSPIQVTYAIGSPDAPQSIIDQDIINKKQAKNRQMETAKNQPAVARIIKMFRGDIKTIKMKSNKSSFNNNTSKGSTTLEDINHDE